MPECIGSNLCRNSRSEQWERGGHCLGALRALRHGLEGWPLEGEQLGSQTTSSHPQDPNTYYRGDGCIGLKSCLEPPLPPITEHKDRSECGPVTRSGEPKLGFQVAGELKERGQSHLASDGIWGGRTAMPTLVQAFAEDGRSVSGSIWQSSEPQGSREMSFELFLDRCLELVAHPATNNR